MGLSVAVGCSFSAGEGLAATAFTDDLGGEDERNSANGGASEVPYGFGSSENRGRKVLPMASVDTRGQKPPFSASPPICLCSGTGVEYKKQSGPKALTTLVLFRQQHSWSSKKQKVVS